MYTIGEQMASDCHTLTFLFQQDYLSFDTTAAWREVQLRYRFILWNNVYTHIVVFFFFAHTNQIFLYYDADLNYKYYYHIHGKNTVYIYAAATTAAESMPLAVCQRYCHVRVSIYIQARTRTHRPQHILAANGTLFWFSFFSCVVVCVCVCVCV